MNEDASNSSHLINPFTSKVGDDFIGFNSSSSDKTENQRERFTEKRGRNIRSRPWQRFQDFSGGNPYPSQRGRGNFSRFNSGRNSHNSWRGNQVFRGHQEQRNHQNIQQKVPYFYHNPDMHRQQHQNQNSSRENFQRPQKSLFHPSMIEDPWADLLNKRKSFPNSLTENSNLIRSLDFNTSFVPPECNAVINPAPDVHEFKSFEDDDSVPSPSDETNDFDDEDYI